MKAILKTTNPATLNFAEAILNEAGIGHVTMDQNMSLVEGSIGIIPRRLMVVDDDYPIAVRALEDAGLADEVFRG